jgi:hypothetical protein
MAPIVRFIAHRAAKKEERTMTDNPNNQTFETENEMESLNDEDIAIDTLDERAEFSTIRALWDCGCDGTFVS